MICTCEQLGELAGQWDELALLGGSMFMTREWLDSWSEAFGEGRARWMLLQDEDGAILAGTRVLLRGGRLVSTTNSHGPDWEILARDEGSREALAEAIAHGPRRIALQGMLADADGARALEQAFASSGYLTARVPGPHSPWLALPATTEELDAGISGSLRSQVGRRTRGLQREGELSFRVADGSHELERDLETFFALEASGWKGEQGTAITSRPETDALYRRFAAAAASRGWLRLYFLELDGRAIAADFGCAFAGTGVFMKTGFDERYSRLSPGLVLRAEVLRSSIREGLSAYDFLGDPDTYKTRWTAEVRPRVSLWAYRRDALPEYMYRTRLRPGLKLARDRLRSLRGEAVR